MILFFIALCLIAYIMSRRLIFWNSKPWIPFLISISLIIGFIHGTDSSDYQYLKTGLIFRTLYIDLVSICFILLIVYLYFKKEVFDYILKLHDSKWIIQLSMVPDNYFSALIVVYKDKWTKKKLFVELRPSNNYTSVISGPYSRYQIHKVIVRGEGISATKINNDGQGILIVEDIRSMSGKFEIPIAVYYEPHEHITYPSGFRTIQFTLEIMLMLLGICTLIIL